MTAQTIAFEFAINVPLGIFAAIGMAAAFVGMCALPRTKGKSSAVALLAIVFGLAAGIGGIIANELAREDAFVEAVEQAAASQMNDESEAEGLTGGGTKVIAFSDGVAYVTYDYDTKTITIDPID